MAATLEIKYFNSYILKNTEEGGAINQPRWNGSKGIPQVIGGFAQFTSFNYPTCFAIEESRIRGGFNDTQVDLGVRAYLVELEPNANFRVNSMIYSGIYNSRTGVNDTNVFSIAEEITKSLDPANGSIQKLYAEDTNLIIFQQYKVNKALIDKDAIYTAEGGGMPVSSFKTVIGQIVPIIGNYGIGDHLESFVVYGYNKYFVDISQNCVCRLHPNHIEEISSTGMRSFFRNQIVNIDFAGSKGKLLGAWDIYNQEYVLSLQPADETRQLGEPTVSFDERAQGWISFFSYKPSQSFSIRNQHYTTFEDSLYLHNSTAVNYNSFYGASTPSSVEFTFNPEVSNSKVFNTISYEGSNGWRLDSYVSDETGPGTFASNSDSYRDTTNSVLSLNEGEYVIANTNAVTTAASTGTSVGITGMTGPIPNGAAVSGIGVTPGTVVTTFNPLSNTVVVDQALAVDVGAKLNFYLVVNKVDYQAAFGTTSPNLNVFYSGFYRKENKYCANLINNSIAAQGEVIFGNQISGIKGFFVNAKISTDTTTDVGGFKELFAVSSNYTFSSGY
mgnify:FL=1